MLAAFLRLFRLDSVPPGMFSDIATNGLDIQDVFAGHLHVFFPANNGREALFIYVQALLVAGGGNHLLVYTYAAVAMGMLSVALTWRLFRAMFGYRVATIAASLLAVEMWGVALSRVGLRFSSVPALLLITLYLVWRTLRTGRWRYALFGGASLGLSQYTYTSARLIPVLVLVIVCIEWRLARKSKGQLLAGMLVALAVFVPEGLYFVSHPDQVLGRAAQVSVFNPAPEVERSRDTLAESALKTAGMFFVRGDTNQRGNIPGRPVFDPPVAIFFSGGLLVALWKLHVATPFRWLLAWLMVMSLPSALAQSSPDQFRIYSVAPAAFGLTAVGFQALWAAFPNVLTSVILPAAAIVWTFSWTAALYFGVWAADPKTDEAFGGGAYRLAHYLAARPESQMLLAFHDRWPIELLVPRTQRAHWLREDITAMALPSSADADTLFVAAPFAAVAPDTWLPGLEPLPHSIAATGVPDFLAYRWPVAEARRWRGQLQPLQAAIGADFDLAGFGVGIDGSRRAINLLWQPRAAAGPYDLYVHVLDGSGRQVAQCDSIVWPAEDGPAGGYVLLTRCPLELPPGRYVAEAGAVHRSVQNPAQLVGEPVGQAARIAFEVETVGS